MWKIFGKPEIKNYLAEKQKLEMSRQTFKGKTSSSTDLPQKHLSSSCQGRVLFRNSYSDCEIRRLLPTWVPTEKGTMVSRVADEWVRERRIERRVKGGRKGRAGKRQKRKEWGRRNRENGRRDEGGAGTAGGGFALKFKYHSQGRALTLRSVEHSGPI